MKRIALVLVVVSLVAVWTTSPAEAAPITYATSAATAAGIQATVDAFRTDLGVLNANVAGSFGSGRREINWDGVPNALSAPNLLPVNFFNVNSPRGVVLSTPGTGFQVSANSASGTPIQFGNINGLYQGYFDTFSAERLFTAMDSNIVDISFFIPGSTTAALTRGFGLVFTDVDTASTTSIEYFDALNNSLLTLFAPNFSGDNTLSFLGASFDTRVVSRVRITSGNQALGASSTGDVVAMDDFIYAEPSAVPEPATVLLLSLGLIGLAGVRRKLIN